MRLLPVVIVALAVLIAARSARAAEVVFRPALTFGLFHDGNVNVVNYDASTGMETSTKGDDLASIAVDLAVDRNSPNSTLSFSYRPAYRKYKEASELDYFENIVLLAYSREIASGTRTDVGFDAMRSQSQGIRSFNASRPSNLIPRTQLTRTQAHVDGTIAAAQRSFIDWGFRGGIDRYDAVEGITLQNDAANAAWRYALSERGTLGLGVDVGWIGFQAVAVSGSVPVESLSDVVTENLSLVGTQSVSRMTTLDYGAGVVRSTSAGRSFTNGSFDLTVSRLIADRSELRAGVAREVTPGTGFGGASLDTGGWVAYSHNAPRRGLNGSLNGAYWLRETVDSEAADSGRLTTLNLSGALGWNFSPYLALNATYAYVDQGSPAGSASALDTRYGSYGLFLRWSLRGR
jgi:hypothetical protein